MKIEGLPEGFEIVRIGSPNKGEDFVIHSGEVMTSVVDFISDCYVIVRRIDEPSPGDGWRWVEVGEIKQDGDEHKSNNQWRSTKSPGFRVVCDRMYRRRVGPRLRKVGERIENGDWVMLHDGAWAMVPDDMVGMEVVGGWYQTWK